MQRIRRMELTFWELGITRDEDGTVWCDQSKYILHFMRENELINKEGQVVCEKAACLGILASLMVRRPQEIKNHLVNLWRYLWTTKDHAMCTLPSPEPARKIQKDECTEANPSGAQDGPLAHCPVRVL